MSNYFSFEEADPRDKELRAAKRLGVVPDGCLLHGALVLGMHEMGEDPCIECSGPRERCGGRPMRPIDDEVVDGRGASPTRGLERTDDATFRRLERLRTIKKLRDITNEKRE